MIDPVALEAVVARFDQPADPGRFDDVLLKARSLEGLDESEVAVLVGARSPEQTAALFAAAHEVKETIYGPRLVFFAPLYVSNLCHNDCSYCAFRSRNTALARRVLTQAEVAAEVRALVSQGHKRVLLVAGEAYPQDEGLDYVLRCIDTVYATKLGTGEIRRVNVNVAPLETAEFRRLAGAGIGTYQLFQETYHRPTYEEHHTRGPKADYDWRLNAMDRAMEAGIEDVGIGALFGLYDWRYELLALLQHARHLEGRFGVGPHTISVPRLEPAHGSSVASRPPWLVSDEDFLRLVAILRLAVPYTGIILSTRESAALRRRAFQLGVSQISAGSRTDPGGYAGGEAGGQFELGDHRPLDEVVKDVAEMGFVPSFCTACYRLGRTGADFMDLARPGEIKAHCDPNALSTLAEYLADYAPAPTREAGEALLGRRLEAMPDEVAVVARQMAERVRRGERDVFV